MVIFLLLFLLSTPLYADAPITPDKVLSAKEIQQIVDSKNYFLYKDLDDEHPVWMQTHRKYGKHFFDHRDHIFSYEDILHRVLTDSFPIQDKIQELYRGHLGIHIQLGHTLPQFNLTFGQGVTGGMDQFASGLYNFMLPANWMQLANENRLYRITKYTLMKVTLDQLLLAKKAYLRQHQLIQEFEILNYYFIHLQLFAKQYAPTTREVKTIYGKFAALGTDMALKRAQIRLGFEELAQIIALAKLDNHSGTGHFNIENIEHFPVGVLNLKDQEDVYHYKHQFIKEVIQNSLELKIFNQYYKISRLNIGITAFGTLQVPETYESHNPDDQEFHLKLGYGTLPAILVANSFAKTAKIDVQKEYIEMLSIARDSFDYHLNSIGQYTEAKRALELNRDAFKANLDFLFENGKNPDNMFIRSLDQLMQSEFRMNEALHLSLMAHAYMDRYLLREMSDVFKFLPNRGEVLKQFKKLNSGDLEAIKRGEEISLFFENLKSTKELDQILNHRETHPLFKNLSEEELILAVKNNMGPLLYSRIHFYKRHTFFKTLDAFISKHKITLTQMEAYLLKQKKLNWFHRFFHGSHKNKGETLHDLDFSNYGKE